jgi:hypothetical protein
MMLVPLFVGFRRFGRRSACRPGLIPTEKVDQRVRSVFGSAERKHLLDGLLDGPSLAFNSI